MAYIFALLNIARMIFRELFGDSDFALLQVMERTNTIVTWPSRLKIGAKSKKGK